MQNRPASCIDFSRLRIACRPRRICPDVDRTVYPRAPSGALLGQYYGAGSVAQATRKLGRTLPIHLTYYAWDADWTGAVTKADLAAGRIPLVSWEPHHIDFAKIIDGSFDATIMARARMAPKHSASSFSLTLPPR